MADETFDLIIIGSGSGNSLPDSRFDDWSIALVDAGIFGGTCLNVGCIPTKMFVYPADVAASARDGAHLGVHAEVSTDWPHIAERVMGKVDRLSAGGLRYRVEDCPNITVYPQVARLAGAADAEGVYSVALADATVLRGRRVVLAAGSRPVIPDAIAHSGVTFHTNETIMRLPQLPRRIVIVGGGAIAAEFGHIFSDLGAEVTIVVRGERLLRHFEAAVSERFTDIVRKRWDLRTNVEITAASDDEGGVRVSLSDESTVAADVLLVATGRQPNGDRLNLGAVGIELDDRGSVPVDEYQRTSAPHIYALGDVSSAHLLKHVANQDARVVQANLLAPWDDPVATSNHQNIPDAVFSRPQVAAVGLTAAEARQRGHNVAVAEQEYADVAYGWAMDDRDGLCVLVADRATRRLLGAHIVGAEASILLQTAVTALTFDIPVPQLARGQYWPHPALTEVVENALLKLSFD